MHTKRKQLILDLLVRQMSSVLILALKLNGTFLTYLLSRMKMLNVIIAI